MIENQHVTVIVLYGDENYMEQTSDTPIMPENIPAVSRALMDRIYIRLDGQVEAAKLRAHRRRLRTNHRERAVGQVLASQEKGAGE